MKFYQALIVIFTLSLSQYAQAGVSCGDALEKMYEYVKSYQDAAYAQNSALAEQNYQSAQDLMFPQDKSSPECQYALMVGYVEASVMVSPPIRPGGNVLDVLMSTGDLFSHSDEVAMLLNALNDNHQIKFLTEKFRHSKQGRWLMKDDTGSYLSTGAYDCDTTTIYIDPTLRPLDEAISVFHEMSHLARDKTTQQINPEYIHNGQVDWQAYNLDDEVSGILFSAAAQADLQETYYKTRSSSNYRVQGDLSFFSSEGLVYRIFKSNKSKPCKMDYSRNGCAARGQFFLARTDSMIAAQLFYSMDELFKPEQLSVYAQIRKTIWDAYFIQSEGSESVSTEPPMQPKGRNRIYGMGLDELYIDAMNDKNPYPSPAMLIALFKQKSLACTLYEKDMKAGNIKRYLGSEFQDEEEIVTAKTSPAPRSLIKPCLRFGKKL